MLKIALDFDSVLSDTMIAWTKKFNEENGTELTKDSITCWKFWEDPQINIELDYAVVFFRKSWEDWENLPATEENLDQKVDKLSEYGTIDIVTNVDETHLKYVKKWLDNGKINVNEVKHAAGSEKISLPYNLFIDDSPSLANLAKANNKNCFVYHQQWNIHIENSETVTRVNSLAHAIDVIAEKGF